MYMAIIIIYLKGVNLIGSNKANKENVLDNTKLTHKSPSDGPHLVEGNIKSMENIQDSKRKEMLL